MKRIFSIAVMVAAFAFGSQAQDKTQEDHRKHKAVKAGKSVKADKANKAQKGEKAFKKNTKDDLNLSASQQEQMKNVNLEFRNQSKAIKENKSLSREERNQQLKALHTKRREAVKAILTPEQQQKIVKYKKSRKKQHNREGSIK